MKFVQIDCGLHENMANCIAHIFNFDLTFPDSSEISWMELPPPYTHSYTSGYTIRGKMKYEFRISVKQTTQSSINNVCLKKFFGKDCCDDICKQD